MYKRLLLYDNFYRGEAIPSSWCIRDYYYALKMTVVENSIGGRPYPRTEALGVFTPEAIF